jgi:hypothetical protein
MVSHIAEWLAKPFADFSQIQSFKIEQFERLPLYGSQVIKRTSQLRKIESYADFVFDIGLAH